MQAQSEYDKNLNDDFTYFSKYFYYENDQLFWAIDHGPVRAHDAAGTYSKSSRNYQVSLNGIRMQVTHVIWLLHHGVWPSGTLRHIDKDPHNNSIQNLRDVPRSYSGRIKCNS